MTVLLSSDRSCLTRSLGATGPVDARDALSLAGTIVDGRYLVERVVGQGGFGIVYRVRHLRLDSPVALKVLRLPHRMTESERDAFAKRFLQEGKLLFRLGSMHPGFVRVFEAGILSAGNEDVVPYLAMDWLDGEALDRQLQRMRVANMPPIELGTALLLMSAIVESTATAHALGVAHLDIKPGNIFLSQQGNHLYPRLLDFGIAKMMRANPALADCSEVVFRGPRAMTPAYAAPEQWQSELGPTGPWTDVHALALTLVELLTGERVFKGQSRSDLQALCLAARRPTPRAMGCRLPARVERVFQRALSIEPRRRYPNARGFWRELCAAAGFNPNSSLSISIERFRLLRDKQSAPTALEPLDPTTLSQLFSESIYANIVRAMAEEPPSKRRPRLTSPRVLAITGLGVIGATMAAVALSRADSAKPPDRETPAASAATWHAAQPAVTESELVLSSVAEREPESANPAELQPSVPPQSLAGAKRTLAREARAVDSDARLNRAVSSVEPTSRDTTATDPPGAADLLNSNALRQRH